MQVALLEAEIEEQDGATEELPAKLPIDMAESSSLGVADTEATATDGAGVSAEDVEDAIENKRIGERIKYLRQRKQMGLVELGRHTGLSASFLSQLETGRVVPTLRNLARIAMVFSKDMSFFFEPEKPESLGHVPGFSQGAAGKRISPYIAEFLPATETRQPRSHRHAGMELLYVLQGSLKLTHDGKEDSFDEGDALYFDAGITHSYECAGDRPCKALILTMPEALRGNHTGSHIPKAKVKS